MYRRVNEITRSCVLVTILRAAEIVSKAYGILGLKDGVFVPK